MRVQRLQLIYLSMTLMVGPTLYKNLVHILLKLRSYRVALSGDVSKMYRAVQLGSPSFKAVASTFASIHELHLLTDHLHIRNSAHVPWPTETHLLNLVQFDAELVLLQMLKK